MTFVRNPLYAAQENELGRNTRACDRKYPIIPTPHGLLMMVSWMKKKKKFLLCPLSDIMNTAHMSLLIGVLYGRFWSVAQEERY